MHHQPPSIDPVDAVDIALMRRGHRRLEAHEERSRLLARLESLDEQLDDLARQRRHVVERLDLLRDELWPRTRRTCRRPPAADGGPIPPEPADALPLGGVDLRSACQLMLRRNGAMSLRELHAMLHRYGYALGSHKPVQRLSDALRYEVSCGRARRVSRGVYAAESHDDLPRTMRDAQQAVEARPVLPWSSTPAPTEPPLADPELRRDPSRWTPIDWPPHAVGDANHWILPPDSEGAHHDEADAERATARLRLANERVHPELTNGPPDTPGRLASLPELLATIRRRFVANALRERHRQDPNGRRE